MCNVFVNAYPNSGCPYCNPRSKQGVVFIEESLGILYPYSQLVWSKKNQNTCYDVFPFSHQKVWWKCPNNKHEDYLRNISETVRYDFRCPQCSREAKYSNLQQKIDYYLTNELGYKVNHEFDCTILPPSKSNYNNIKLPYDNEITDLKLIIEVHGKQHYIPCSWHTLTAKRNGTSTQIEFQKQKGRDLYKKEYAINQGYEYLEIPYYLEENEKYKKVILDKIKQITE